MATGVYETTKKDGSTYYRASINFKNKHISLGSSSKKSEANSMYREAKAIIESQNPKKNNKKSNNNIDITIENFTTHITHLNFEKAIIILNFRDNNIYIKNPIYLQKGFFHYYISPREFIKFDNDDLFYYSSHKIIKRQGHLFVNDYGMQYNIAQRYGIRNFAVEGRDYEFANGDNHDYSYSNIIILNKYYGITSEEKNNKIWYIAKLHLNGKIIIGKYTNETKAAIAYNKAIDYARKKGIDKNFIENYIEDLSAREYADIYTRVGLTDSFYNYVDNYIK
ncbi:MAG: hypothetical protein K6B67_02025 [Lachnospiraceae bacterium]|nr:hypothetical protein [Lachnospiraceae bacterium]